MLLKWIVCQVSRNQRAAFSRAQRQWSALRSVGGFCGQVGGWNLKEAGQACILGLWADQKTYGHFMEQVHDGIVESSGQRRTYGAGSVLLIDALLDIEGTRPTLDAALADGGLLRVADCLLKPGRAAHFIEMQRTVWNPRMADAGGMLAGAFGLVQGQADHYLVFTLWKDEGVHRSYVERVLPTLQQRAKITDDLRQIRGYAVNVELGWRVPAV